MRKIKIDVVNDYIYEEKLENGFEIYMIPNKDVKGIIVDITFKYGSIDREFIPYNESEYIKSPSGIAHFLEHLKFKTTRKTNKMTKIMKNGAHLNAVTMNKKTSYYFSSVNNVTENINLLMYSVFQFNINKKIVEEEKPIIIEEKKMQEDKPTSSFWQEVDNSIYINEILKESAIGTYEDIKDITIEDLKRVNDTFYIPSNAYMVVTGNFKPDKIVDTVNNFFNKNKYPKFDIVKKGIEEDKNVARKEFIIKEKGQMTRFAYAFKIPIIDELKLYKEWEKRLYTSTYFNSMLGNTSLFGEKITNNKIAAHNCSIDYYYDEDGIVIIISNVTENISENIKLIDEEIKKFKMTEDMFRLNTKGWKTSYIKSLDKMGTLNTDWGNYITFYKNIEDTIIFNINKANYNDLINFIKNIDLSTTSIIYTKKDL